MKHWLQLFRLPNLFTVPGDPLAAFLIATRGHLDARVLPAVAASLCLYAAGLAMNDLADFEEDQRDRPRRPLPSGAISKGSAQAAVVALSAAGIGLLAACASQLALILGVVLLGHIILYNFFTKRLPILGPLNMGLCRGLSAAMGAAVCAGSFSPPELLPLAVLGWVPGLQVVLAAILASVSLTNQISWLQIGLLSGVPIALYITAVTNLARHETRPGYPYLPRILPLGMLLLGYIALKDFTRPILLDQSPTLWVVGMILAGVTTSQLMREPPPPLPPRIGSFISILPVLQAALCLAPDLPTRFHKTPDSALCALLLLACVPIHAWLGKKFYAS